MKRTQQNKQGLFELDNSEEILISNDKSIVSYSTLNDVLPPQISSHEKLENLMSDHLPQLHCKNGINILNWNILTKNYFIGFADNSGEKSIIETDESYKKRLQNIVNYLVKTTHTFNLNIIALQEAYEDLFQFLPDKFKNSWAVVTNSYWKIIFYKKSVWKQDKHFKLTELLTQHFHDHQVKSIKDINFQGVILTNKENKTKIAFYNVYTQHEDEPHNLEKAINAVISSHNSHKLLKHMATYIVGDFNRRLPDCGIYAKDNATHLIPPMFRNNFTPSKLYDYTDCCFELTDQGLIQNNGLLLDTQNPGQIFHRPLLKLEEALLDNHFHKVIYPEMHKIRLIDRIKTIFGEITVDKFIRRLELTLKQPITEFTVTKNRYSVMILNISLKKPSNLLDNLKIAKSNNIYTFKVVPQTTDNVELRIAAEFQHKELMVVQIINKANRIVDLILSP